MDSSSMLNHVFILLATLVFLKCHNINTESSEVCEREQWFEVLGEFDVCKYAGDPGEMELSFPTKDCNHDKESIEEFLFTSFDGGEFDDLSVPAGSYVQLSCRVQKTENVANSILFIWMCRRQSPQFHQCLCPTSATRSSELTLAFDETHELSLTLNYTLENIDYSDSDDYYCVTQVSGGKWIYGISTIHIDVKNEIPPVILEQPSNVTVNAGTLQLLSCEYLGFPFPDCLWLKDGEQIDVNNSTRFEVSMTNSVCKLKINTTIPEDTGSYQCIVANKQGTTSSWLAMLTVEETTAYEAKTEKSKIVSITVGVLVAAVIIVIIVTLSVIYQRRLHHQRELLRIKEEEKRKPIVTIDRVDGTNVTLNIGGDNAEVNFANVTIGGADIGEYIAEPEVDGLVDNFQEPDFPDDVDEDHGNQGNDVRHHGEEEMEMLNVQNT